MKKSIVQNFFPADMPVQESLRLAKRAGFEGMQLVMRAKDAEVSLEMTGRQARQLKRLADGMGMKLHSLMPSLGVSLADDTRAKRKKALQMWEGMIPLGKALGCGSILVHPGQVRAHTLYTNFYRWVVTALKILKKSAEKHRIRLLLENVWNRFIYSPMEARQLLNEVRSEYVGFYFDVGNIMLVGYPQQWIRILGRRIGEVHIKDFRTRSITGAGFVYPLMGDVDWHAVMQELARIGYAGFLCAEYGPYPQFADKALRDISTSIDALIALAKN